MSEIKVIKEKFSRCPECRSFSVKQVDPNFTEKMKGNFLPVSAYACENCSYRFAVYGNFSVKYKKNWIVVVTPLVLAAVLVAVFVLTGRQPTDVTQPPPPVKQEQKTPETKPEQKTETDETTETTKPETTKPEQKPEQQTETVETTEPDKTPETKPEQQQEIPEETPPAEPEIEITDDIILGTSNRFGVNWNTVANGVKITRLSNGPFKRAGLKVGDVLSEVDGEKIPTRDYLLTIRNEIFRGRRDEAVIKVYRNNKPLYFRLVKTKKKNETQSRTPDPTTPGKVFSANNIKTRASAPNSESPENRWCFQKKDVTVKRESHQRVYVAGDQTGTGKWAVDDQLIINGKTFNGLTSSYSLTSGDLPENVTCEPLDITELVPPGRNVLLKIEMVDHGKTWANTDIYIVIK